AGFAVKIDRDLGVAKAQFANERSEILDGVGHVFRRVDVEFLVVDRQNEGARAALLLGEGTEVAVTGDAQHLDAFGLDGRGQCPYAESGSILGAVVFIDDDDGKSKLHALAPARCAAVSRHAGLGICPPDRGTRSRRLRRSRRTTFVHSPRLHKSWQAGGWCWRTPG